MKMSVSKCKVQISLIRWEKPLSRKILAKYNKTQQLYLRTDASIVGIGGALHSGPEKSAHSSRPRSVLQT
eukprot:g2186.t1